jgi:hypothetical protein
MTAASSPSPGGLDAGRAVAHPVRRRRRRWIIGIALAIVVLAVAGFVVQCSAISATQSGVATPTPAPRPQARGQIRPVAQARVGTTGGGVVASIAAGIGDAVSEQQEIARVRGATGTEVLTAPFRGTITGVPVHVGDTVLPGAVVATVGDLTKLQVETTDVDEFLIARVRPGQRVSLFIDALDRQTPGVVRTVALEPVTTTAGDEHYPVTIELLEPIENLRPGMTVRILFPDQA